MSGPNTFEVLFISISHSITLMGKVWLTVMMFLRITILLFAGYPLYQDEQERFVCNTIQPGCSNVCYDLFAPISLFRFWLVELITLCLPYVVFIIYVVHQVSSGLTLEPGASGQIGSGSLYRIRRGSFGETSVKKTAERRRRTPCFAGAYILHLQFRILLEAGFGAAHYYLFGFYIPRRFLCQQPPCTTQVDCYISRPTEKTVMLNFMLGVGALCLFINVLDLICAVKRSVRQKSERKVLVEKMYEEGQYYISAGGASREVDTNTPLVRQDLEEEAGRAGSFRRRKGSKGSSVGGKLGLIQGPPGLTRSPLSCSPASLPPGPPPPNTDGNNGYSAAQEEALEVDGSEVALCPLEPTGTPRSIRVSKRSRLKPPPPPRRDYALPVVRSAGPVGDASSATSVCTRRVGQYTLVELSSGAEPQANDEGQEKRSEWV
ncbi:gap junction delta-4 protein [Lampris incognitus]|uniref:gap junction delta-4 protein n=1 Tax=Lampris incognitus TaxID=2546036 RepID=UPI0024B5943C|nr:gap junction delta-4 protein [Lampris incognitus]